MSEKRKKYMTSPEFAAIRFTLECLQESARRLPDTHRSLPGCPGPVMDLSFFTYFSNKLCAVNLKVLGLKAYWYTDSTFTRYLQLYLTLPNRNWFLQACI